MFAGKPWIVAGLVAGLLLAALLHLFGLGQPASLAIAYGFVLPVAGAMEFRRQIRRRRND
jgi:hypothetical protein